MVAGGCAWLLGVRVWLVHAWLPGGMHGCQGVYMVAGGHAWLPQGACVVAERVCMVAGGYAWLPGGVCGCVGGHVWWLGGGGMHGIRRDMVNERAVRILLECILVE